MDGRAQYEQIAAHYRSQILNGALPLGTVLPTLSQIATEWDVTRGTAARGIEALRHEGLVMTAGRRGTRVVAKTQTTMAVALDVPEPVGLRVRETVIVAADENVAQSLGVIAGSSVLVIRFG